MGFHAAGEAEETRVHRQTCGRSAAESVSVTCTECKVSAERHVRRTEAGMARVGTRRQQ